MPDNKSIESRRKSLKFIAAGSGAIVTGKSLPESWSRPVIDSVMLPAHALTSPTIPTHTCGQCGAQLLRDGIGGLPEWDVSGFVVYDFVDFSYNLRWPAIMRQFVSLDSNCAGSLLRFNMGDGGGAGPLDISLFVGTIAQQAIYTGGGLTLEITIHDGILSPGGVVISTRSLPYDNNTTIIRPTLTEIC